MNERNQISDSLKQRGLDARAKLNDESYRPPEGGSLSGVKGQFVLTVLGGLVTGIFGFLAFEGIFLPVKFVSREESGVGGWIVLALVVGIVLIGASFQVRWYAREYEQKWKKLEPLKGKTYGVVTGLRKDLCGAPDSMNGWMYQPVFSVEYEVSGRTYSTNWEMPYSTNSENILNRSEDKHMGEILPVRFHLNAPENAMVAPSRNFSISKIICLLTAFLGFLFLSASITAIVVFA